MDTYYVLVYEKYVDKIQSVTHQTWNKIKLYLQVRNIFNRQDVNQRNINTSHPNRVDTKY